MSQPNGHPAKYELYYNPFSICSLMVLYTLRLKGQPKSPDDAVDPEEHFTDIYAGDQMTEKYLQKHPEGHVRPMRPCQDDRSQGWFYFL